MLHHDLTVPKVLALAIVAVLLGITVLELDTTRRAASTQAAPGTTAVASAATPAGALAADTGAANAAVPAPAPPVEPAPPADEPVVVETRGGIECARPHRTVEVTRDTVIHSAPGGAAVATLPSSSRYLGQATTAWVQEVSANGRWGKVSLPWSKPVNRVGWVPIVGMQAASTRTLVVADLSERRLHVYRGCDEQFSVRTAIGRPGSPSPEGRFWVTDRVAVPSAQQGSFGTFAFGLSTVQPNLPAGWTGGDQMAIHGTGAPGSVGEAASAGCLRVTEDALKRLRPLLRNGTPVVIQA